MIEFETDCEKCSHEIVAHGLKGCHCRCVLWRTIDWNSPVGEKREERPAA